MTEAATALQAAPRDRTTRLADTVRLGPAEWVWALTLGVQVLITGLLTSYTYFFVDDFLLLRQAQTSSFDLTYLRVPLFEHFSPVTRIFNKLVVDIAPGSFGFAHALELVMYAAAIAAMMFVLRTIMGRTWAALALTLLFGQSIFLLRLLTWWTATANILPATVGMLLATGAYLRWWMRGGNGWLVLAFAAFLVALLDYETAMLFPINLLLIRLLVLSDRLDPREWVRIVWRERAAWIGFGVLDIAALANYFHRYYSQMPHPTGGQVVHFLDIAFFETFIPGLFGIKQLPSSGTATAVATTIAFAAIVGVTLYFRPRAWRCLVVLLAAFLITLVPLGLNRIRLFGVTIGAEPYYHQTVQFMFIVLAGFAITRRWGGERANARVPWRARNRVVLVTPPVVAATVAYAVLYLSSADVLKGEGVLPRDTHAYVERVRADARRLGGGPSMLNLIDLTVPLMPNNFVPFNHYSQFFPVVEINFQYNEANRLAYAVSPFGALYPVKFVPLASGRLAYALLTTTGQAGARPAERRPGEACVPAGPPGLLRIPMSHPQTVTPRLNQLPYALRVGLTLPNAAVVPVLLSGHGTLVPTNFDHPVWSPGRGAMYSLIVTRARFDQVALDLPGGACVTETTSGIFRSGSA